MKLQRILTRGDFGVIKLFCDADDVAKLEAVNAELVAAAKDVIARWDSPLWKMEEHIAEFIKKLRQLVAKCEGLV